jgi:hypothetical protein
MKKYTYTITPRTRFWVNRGPTNGDGEFIGDFSSIQKAYDFAKSIQTFDDPDRVNIWTAERGSRNDSFFDADTRQQYKDAMDNSEMRRVNTKLPHWWRRIYVPENIVLTLPPIERKRAR